MFVWLILHHALKLFFDWFLLHHAMMVLVCLVVAAACDESCCLFGCCCSLRLYLLLLLFQHAMEVVVVVVIVVAACDDSEPLLFLAPSSAQLQSISLPDPRGFLPTKFGPETLINCTDSRAPQPTLRGFKFGPARPKLCNFDTFFTSKISVMHQCFILL